MKINKIIGLLACTMAFTACQNDMLEADMQQNKIYTLSGKMSAGKAMSRAQIELGSSNSAEEIAFWNEGDAFALYQNINDNLSTSVFTISDDYSEGTENRQSATFTTDNPAELGVEYVAVYPAGLTVNDGKVDMNFNDNHLDFSGATTEAERAATWKGYMNRYMYMLAQGKLVNGEMNVVSFQHLCAMFRVTYSNATEETKDISALSFTGDMYSNGITYNLKDRYQCGSGATSNYSTSFSGLTVQPGETVDLYVFLFPREFNSEGEVHVNLNINSEQKTVVLPTSTIQSANGGVAGFEAGKRYWFKVTESSEGLVWSKDFSMETVTIDNKALSLALQSALGEDVVSLNEDSCAVIGEQIVKSLKSLDFENYEGKANLTSLDGIEAFEALEVLICNNAGLTSLKLTNPALREVQVESNPLTSLDVSGLSNLISLSCAFCGDLGNNINIDGTNLEVIKFQHTNATVAPEGLVPSRLIILDSGDNQLTNLDLSEFTILKELYLARNDLSNETLLLPQNNNLRILDISGNEKFTAFDLTQSPKLNYLWASGDAIESLDFSQCPNIEFISCADNKLTELDLTNNENVYYLECGNQKEDRTLTLKLPASLVDKWNNEWASNNNNVKLDASGDDTPSEGTITIKNTELSDALYKLYGDVYSITINSDGYAEMHESEVLAITELNLDSYEYEPYNGQITTLDGIEHFVNLEYLECRNFGLTSCDVSKNVALKVFAAQGTKNLTSLDFSNNPEIEALYLNGNNGLTSLNLTGCTKLYNLQLFGSALTSLDIPNKNAMQNLLFGGSLILNPADFPNLTGLGCENTDLTDLDSFIPDAIKANLGHLFVSNNQITSIELSKYPNLKYLDCGANQIEALDLTNASSLTSLFCSNNKITSLDITKLDNLDSLGCGSQKNETVLTLTLTESQKSTWDNEWSANWGNENVKVVVAGSGSTTEGGSSTTSGSDFTIEGIY